jgi:glycosyltransferase AglE
MNERPFVSVIAPAYNNAKTVRLLVESLLRQSYPAQNFEIIIVDNNSTDETRSVLESLPVKTLGQNIQSSYAARNIGIAAARGSILAFIDADCIAAKDWLEAGVKKLLSDEVHLAGGKVDFFFSAKKTASESYDSITHFDMEWSIKHRGTTGSGNLFVKREVFSKIGLFRQDVKSGADMQFSHKAVTSGFGLVYAPEARVSHPARLFGELVQKSCRIGYGSAEVMASRCLGRGRIIVSILREMLPPRPGYIKKMIDERGTSDMHQKFFQIFAVACTCRFVKGLGGIAGYLKLISGKKRNLP